MMRYMSSPPPWFSSRNEDFALINALAYDEKRVKREGKGRSNVREEPLCVRKTWKQERKAYTDWSFNRHIFFALFLSDPTSYIIWIM